MGLNCDFLEPPIGIEPMTYSLREARTAALHPLPAPMATQPAREALYAPRTAVGRSTTRSTAGAGSALRSGVAFPRTWPHRSTPAAQRDVELLKLSEGKASSCYSLRAAMIFRP